MTRESVSLAMRFAILRRDKFACQYCGAKAPDAARTIRKTSALHAYGVAQRQAYVKATEERLRWAARVYVSESSSARALLLYFAVEEILWGMGLFEPHEERAIAITGLAADDYLALVLGFLRIGYLTIDGDQNPFIHLAPVAERGGHFIARLPEEIQLRADFVHG